MPNQARNLKDRRTLWYTLGRLLMPVLNLLVFPVRYHGKEMINRVDAPYMIVANHGNMLDPIVIGAAVKRYEIHYLGKQELVRNRLLKHLFDKLHMISVARHMTDMAAMRACNAVLKGNKVLGIFPEGTRRPPDELMQGVESGVSLLALRNRVPLMPVYIHVRLRPFRVTHIYFLPELHYEDLLRQGVGKDAVDALTARLVQTMMDARESAKAELLPR
ncbi:MAG: lysophospholipid acyltransferase family protein [Christensenellales bacterium]